MAPRIQFHPLVRAPSELDPFPSVMMAEMMRAEGLADGVVNLILADDDELTRLNETFRGRTGPTDVLAFPYDVGDRSGVAADVYVSADQARAQADAAGEPVGLAVLRLFVHGALHVLGYRHDDDAGERRMLEAQGRWLERLWT